MNSEVRRRQTRGVTSAQRLPMEISASFDGNVVLMVSPFADCCLRMAARSQTKLRSGKKKQRSGRCDL